MGIDFGPVPPRRHSKNPCEPKHRVIRDVYLRLISENPTFDKRLLMTTAIRISNDLYGNTLASAHELAKGYTRPVSGNKPIPLPDEIRCAHEELVAKRKLNLILKSKSIIELPISVGDIVEIYVKRQNDKRGKWSEPLPVLSYDKATGTVTVPSTDGRTRKAAVEDVRFSVSHNALATEIQHGIDLIQQEIMEYLSNSETHNDSTPSFAANSSSIDEIDDDIIQFNLPVVETTQVDEGQENNFFGNERIFSAAELERITHIPEVPSTFDPDNPPDDVIGINAANVIIANDIELLPGTELSSIDQEALQLYFCRFGSKEFLLNHADGLPTFVTANAFKAEEERFLKECKVVPRSNVPKNANVIRSHVLYKMKERDDGSLTCKARIVPHGNEDSEKKNLKTDSASCPPLGMRVLFSFCNIFGWYLSKIDVKSAFLRTGPANRDVYVIPPHQSAMRHFLWLSTVATYGLVNTNATWQVHSDNTLISMGMNTNTFIPQLFTLLRDKSLILALIKVVDGMFITGPPHEKRKFIEKLSSIYELGTITHLPGKCFFYGLHVTQHEDFSIAVSCDDKLNGIVPHVLSNFRRKQADEKMNDIEMNRFNSINGSIGYIGVHACPIACFVSSYLQQRKVTPTVSNISVQESLLRNLKRAGTVTRYVSPKSSKTHNLSVPVFSDAVKPNTHGQLGFVSGILFGKLEEGSIFYALSWSSSLSKRPTKSTASAEIMAASAVVDEGILIGDCLRELLNIPLPVTILVDSKDLYDFLSSSHVPRDKSIKADLQLIRYYFETKRIHTVVLETWFSEFIGPFN